MLNDLVCVKHYLIKSELIILDLVQGVKIKCKSGQNGGYFIHQRKKMVNPTLVWMHHKFSKAVKYVGLIINQKLFWKAQQNRVLKKPQIPAISTMLKARSYFENACMVIKCYSCSY